MAEPGQVIQPNSSGGDKPDDGAAQTPPPPQPPTAEPPQSTPAPAPPDPAVSPSPAPSPAPTSPQDPNPEPVDDPSQPDPSELESNNGDDTDQNLPPPASPAGGNTNPPAPAGPSPGANLFEWEASEYVEHHHSAGWYAALSIGTLAILAALIIFVREWLSALVVLLMAIAVVVYARRRPRVLQYALAEGGITVGDKFYPYDDFRSFAIARHKAISAIELDPTRRFMPRLSLLFDQNDEDTLTGILVQVIPHSERPPDAVDRLSHYLKF